MILPLSSIKADGVGVSIYVLITVLSARLRPIAILSGESLGYHRISGAPTIHLISRSRPERILLSPNQL